MFKGWTGGSTESYTYDKVGNRLTSAAGSYGYNTSNEMTSSPTATFTYDNNGNTLTKGRFHRNNLLRLGLRESPH